MLFKTLVLLHVLGATIWAGGHLALALAVLPRAMRSHDPRIIEDFEDGYERIAIPALLVQIFTGFWLSWLYLHRLDGSLAFDSVAASHIMAKLALLFATILLAVHAKFFMAKGSSHKNLAFHIVGVTAIAVMMVVIGVGIRVGGFF